VANCVIVHVIKTIRVSSHVARHVSCQVAHHIGSQVARHVGIQVASKSAAMSHQSVAIRDDFILSRIVSHGLGCMGLGLLRDDSDTSRIATFIKGTLRDLINDAHSTTKM
jgi:hypothetical protein